MHIEGADGAADLLDQEVGGTEWEVVSFAPEHAHLATDAREITEKRAAAADFPAVEARMADAVRVDVDGLLGDAGGIAQHVDEQVVAADLAEEFLVVSRLAVA